MAIHAHDVDGPEGRGQVTETQGKSPATKKQLSAIPPREYRAKCFLVPRFSQGPMFTHFDKNSFQIAIQAHLDGSEGIGKMTESP